MKNKEVTKKTNLDSFTKFKINNPKLIFGGIDDGGIEKGKLRRPGAR